MMTLSMEQPPSQRQLPVMVESELPPSMAVLVLRQHLDLVLPVPPPAGLSLHRPPHPLKAMAARRVLCLTMQNPCRSWPGPRQHLVLAEQEQLPSLSAYLWCRLLDLVQAD